MKDVKEMGFWETFKSIPNRIVSLVFNLISRWGVVLAITSFFIFKQMLVIWPTIICWLIFCIIFLFKTDGVEMIQKILDSIAKVKD